MTLTVTTVQVTCTLFPGRTYVLLFKSVSAEDMGQIKFTAEKACSTANLRVKGKESGNFTVMLKCGCELIL